MPQCIVRQHCRARRSGSWSRSCPRRRSEQVLISLSNSNHAREEMAVPRPTASQRQSSCWDTPSTTSARCSTPSRQDPSVRARCWATRTHTCLDGGLPRWPPAVEAAIAHSAAHAASLPDARHKRLRSLTRRRCARKQRHRGDWHRPNPTLGAAATARGLWTSRTYGEERGAQARPPRSQIDAWTSWWRPRRRTVAVS